jgi:hypothetical protein
VLVAEVLARPEALAPGLAEWVRDLDRAGRAAVAAEAASWVVDARALALRGGVEVEWQRAGSLWHRPAGLATKLGASVDAVRRDGGALRALVVRGRPSPGDARLARRVALVLCLEQGAVPVVAMGYRESLGIERFEPGDDWVDVALGEAVLDLHRAARPSVAPAVAGPGCAWCHLRPECAEGSAHAAVLVAGPAQAGASDPGEEPTM